MDIIKMLEQINKDCAANGGSVVPIDGENAEYYREQLENLGFAESEIAEVVAYLQRS